MPRGTPNASARLARISDCQATVAATWRRLNPRVCRIARSRRRRRTDVSSTCTSVAKAAKPNRSDSCNGRVRAWSVAPTVVPYSSALAVVSASRRWRTRLLRRVATASRSTPGAYRPRVRFSVTVGVERAQPFHRHADPLTEPRPESEVWEDRHADDRHVAPAVADHDGDRVAQRHTQRAHRLRAEGDLVGPFGPTSLEHRRRHRCALHVGERPRDLLDLRRPGSAPPRTVGSSPPRGPARQARPRSRGSASFWNASPWNG